MTKVIFLVMQDNAGNDHIIKSFDNEQDAKEFCSNYNFGNDPSADDNVYIVKG